MALLVLFPRGLWSVTNVTSSWSIDGFHDENYGSVYVWLTTRLERMVCKAVNKWVVEQVPVVRFSQPKPVPDFFSKGETRGKEDTNLGSRSAEDCLKQASTTEC